MAAWSREEIIDAIGDWQRQYGRPPALVDWNPWLARRLGYEDRAARWQAGRWPSANHVVRAFGTWNDAIKAAEQLPMTPGVPRGSPRGRTDGRAWTREEIVAVMRGWERAHGRLPTSADWRAADPDGARPTTAAVSQVFGQRWGQVIAELGGMPHGRLGALARERRELIRALRAERPDMPVVEIASRAGMHPNVVSRHLRKIREEDHE